MSPVSEATAAVYLFFFSLEPFTFRSESGRWLDGWAKIRAAEGQRTKGREGLGGEIWRIPLSVGAPSAPPAGIFIHLGLR